MGTVLSNHQVDDTIGGNGCIRIHRRARWVVMSINFDRLTRVAIAAALYELADMRPENICLVVGENRISEVLVGFGLAFNRICEIFAKAHVREKCSDTPSLRGGAPSTSAAVVEEIRAA
jgi:hypothetical protein